MKEFAVALTDHQSNIQDSRFECGLPRQPRSSPAVQRSKWIWQMPFKASGIAELASLYGIPQSTVRFYEDFGLLAPRRIGTRRLYSPQDKIRLELVLKGKRLGFSLAEIRHLVHLEVAQRPRGCPSSSNSVMERLDRDMICRQLDVLRRRQHDLQIAIGELKAARDIKD